MEKQIETNNFFWIFQTFQIQMRGKNQRFDLTNDRRKFQSFRRGQNRRCQPLVTGN